MLVVSAASMAFTAYGAYSDAKADKEALKYEESVAKNNAKVMENNRMLADQSAADAKQRGEVEAQNHMRKVAAMKGEQQSRLAANGLSLGEGSALSLLEDTDFMGKYDTETMRSNAGREAWGHQIEGMNYQSQANDFKTSAAFSKSKAKQIKPGMNALTAAAANVSDNWSRSIAPATDSAYSNYKNNKKDLWSWKS
jgi:hypothetical protein